MAESAVEAELAYALKLMQAEQRRTAPFRYAVQRPTNEQTIGINVMGTEFLKAANPGCNYLSWYGIHQEGPTTTWDEIRHQQPTSHAKALKERTAYDVVPSNELAGSNW